jgi:NAD(P)-dependent dehydrogenase (short-subunit alcohol dehydrogenase family)
MNWIKPMKFNAGSFSDTIKSGPWSKSPEVKAVAMWIFLNFLLDGCRRGSECHALDFIVAGFSPDMSLKVTDLDGREHPAIRLAPRIELGTERESREEEVRSLIDKTVGRFGRLDVAVNAAGTEGAPGTITPTKISLSSTDD